MRSQRYQSRQPRRRVYAAAAARPARRNYYPMYKRLEGGTGTKPQDYFTMRKTVTQADVVQLFADNLGAMNFHLSNIGDVGDLTQIWDEYRITLIKVTFMPMYRCNGMVDQNLGMSLFIGQMATLYTAVDKTDGSATATIAEIENYQSCFVTDDSKWHVRKFKPKSRAYSADPVGGDAGVADYDQWYRTDNPAVRYYGLKWGVAGTNVLNAQEQRYKVTVQYTIQFRNPN